MGTKRERQPGVWQLRVFAGRADGRQVVITETYRGSASGADQRLAQLGAPAALCGRTAGVFDPQALLGHRRLRDGLTAYEADKWACAVGLHPSEVWGELWWTDEATGAHPDETIESTTEGARP